MHEIAHFAINADDVPATRQFYEAVFGWTFTAWGPPDFYQIQAGQTALKGALQKRRELYPGHTTTGFECTVSVPDVDEVARLVTANGGQVLMEKATITGVGDLIFVADPSGNVVGAMRYDATAD